MLLIVILFNHFLDALKIIIEKYQQIVDQMEATKSKTKTTKSTINITSAQTETSEITENDANNNLDHLAPVFENSNLTNLLEQQQLKVIYHLFFKFIVSVNLKNNLSSNNRIC